MYLGVVCVRRYVAAHVPVLQVVGYVTSQVLQESPVVQLDLYVRLGWYVTVKRLDVPKMRQVYWKTRQVNWAPLLERSHSRVVDEEPVVDYGFGYLAFRYTRQLDLANQFGEPVRNGKE